MPFQSVQENSGNVDLQVFNQLVEIVNDLLAPHAAFVTTTADVTEKYTFCDSTGGPFTITLPPAAKNKRQVYHFRRQNAGANTVTIDGYGSETIDGSANTTLTSGTRSISLYCDGIEWYTIRD